ncbi:Hypothetical_protein [Hexamita inflata]|uniref:Hypothetical_protein n=1 Tax=Hexamita inflata TaxID=28002 RepID=A0AA86VHL9_9EUKA|nr:Hypothetical protein HINF_LOCUS54558 [Hexamita inflata]
MCVRQNLQFVHSLVQELQVVNSLLNHSNNGWQFAEAETRVDVFQNGLQTGGSPLMFYSFEYSLRFLNLAGEIVVQCFQAAQEGTWESQIDSVRVLETRIYFQIMIQSYYNTTWIASCLHQVSSLTYFGVYEFIGTLCYEETIQFFSFL